MKRSSLRYAGGALLLLSIACSRREGSPLNINTTIEAENRQLHAIDNHAQPVAETRIGQEDRFFDALPSVAIQEPALPASINEWISFIPVVWYALFGFDFPDAKPEH